MKKKILKSYFRIRDKFTIKIFLNSTILFRGFGTNSFKWSGAAAGVGWGMAGAAVDAGGNVYENSLYDDTIKYFADFLNTANRKSKGINIISNI